MRQITLDFRTRLALSLALDEQRGTRAEMRIVEALACKIELSEVERDTANLRLESGGFRWELAAAERLAKTIDLSGEELERIDILLSRWPGWNRRDLAWIEPLAAEVARLLEAGHRRP